jgi:hypothetical protein
MQGGLGFLFLKNKLLEKKYNQRVQDVFNETYNELLKRKDDSKEDDSKYNKYMISFMLSVMDLAEEEIKCNNFELAGRDISLLDKLPETIYNKWNKCYFFQSEFLGYCDNMLELDRADKVKLIIHNIYEYLSPIYENTQAMKK